MEQINFGCEINTGMQSAVAIISAVESCEVQWASASTGAPCSAARQQGQIRRGSAKDAFVVDVQTVSRVIEGAAVNRFLAHVETQER